MIAGSGISDIGYLRGCDYPNIRAISVGAQYWNSQSPEQMIWGYFCLEIVRRFEQLLLKQEIGRLIHGPVHSSIGQEAVAIGTAMALTATDKITSTHRAHHHFLAKAIAYYAPPEQAVWDAVDNTDLRTCLRRTLAEIMGLSTGWIGGRGGSMHLFDDASGNIGTQAIVAGNIPYTSGIAFAEKFRGTGNIALAFLGDGGVSIGPFHEGVCIAKTYCLPAIFVIENNLYGVATSVRSATGLDDVVLRASGYNVPGLIVDGMDPLSVKRGVEIAKDHAAAGNGPVVIEAKTYRFFHQSGGTPGSAFGYRTKQEESEWEALDPLVRMPRLLVRQGMLTEQEVDRIRQIADQLIVDAMEHCTEGDDTTRRIRRNLIPEAKTATRYVRSEGLEFANISYASESQFTNWENAKLVQAKSRVIGRWLEKDPEAFVIGEDVANMKGGPYGATRDAIARFFSRVLNAPIAEGGIVGLGHGAAVMGMRPIVELMFCDFGLIAADELFNQVAMCRYMYNNRVNVPLVVRSRCSAGRGYGPQHSSDTVGLFAMFPGWRIVAPATPFDYIGLFNSAMHSQDPVLVLEHHELDQLQGSIPVGDLDFHLKLGSANVCRQGSDLTVLTYLSLVPRLLRIAEELAASNGIELEVVDLRSIDYASIDFDTINSSIRKTGRAMIVEQAMSTQGIGPYVASQIHLQWHHELKQPVRLLNSLPAPVAVSKIQEAALLIGDDEIRQSVISAVRAKAEPPHQQHTVPGWHAPKADHSSKVLR